MHKVVLYEDDPAMALVDISGCSEEEVEELIAAVKRRLPEYTDITFTEGVVQFAKPLAAEEAA